MRKPSDPVRARHVHEPSRIACEREPSPCRCRPHKMTDGPRKPSLHELSRQLPSGDEYATFIDSLHEIDARAAALVLASFIDSMLERAIDLNFLLLSRKKDNALFRDKGAPLSSFSAKIAVAHALGIFDDEYRDQLDRFRAIRNTFATQFVRSISTNPR